MIKNKKTKLIALISIAFLTISTFVLIAHLPVQAQFRGEGEAGGIPGPLPAGVVPDVTITTWGLLSVRPNKVGVNQELLVNLETQPAPGTERLHQDYTVTISKPDGTEQVLLIESYPDDGTMWFPYIADQVGEWRGRVYVTRRHQGRLLPTRLRTTPGKAPVSAVCRQPPVVCAAPTARCPSLC